MKTFALLSTILTAVLATLALVPALQGSAAILIAATLALAIVSVLLVALTGSKESPAPVVSAPAPAPAPAPASVPPPAPPAASAEAEVIAFFGLLQEKGRLLDFLMDDIAPYEDAQVGAAARVVHQGCREILREHFDITPVCASEEGSTVTVPAGDESADYRLVGRIAGEPPFSGTLVHKGWKTKSVKLPRVVASKRLPALTPAEVELR